ncbi:hypothetical protein ACVWZB_004814 [Paenibacillus polymyxa]
MTTMKKLFFIWIFSGAISCILGIIAPHFNNISLVNDFIHYYLQTNKYFSAIGFSAYTGTLGLLLMGIILCCGYLIRSILVKLKSISSV